MPAVASAACFRVFITMLSCSLTVIRMHMLTPGCCKSSFYQSRSCRGRGCGRCCVLGWRLGRSEHSPCACMVATLVRCLPVLLSGLDKLDLSVWTRTLIMSNDYHCSCVCPNAKFPCVLAGALPQGQSELSQAHRGTLHGGTVVLLPCGVLVCFCPLTLAIYQPATIQGCIHASMLIQCVIVTKCHVVS